jgi:hypothetical protein
MNVMPKIDYQHLVGEDVPDVCESCGQKVDKRDPGSIAHHRTPRHLPYAGKRKGSWR